MSEILHRVKRMDSAIGNLVNNIEERLPKDDSNADWMIPLGILIAVIMIVVIAIVCVHWCVSKNKYKYLKNKDVPQESV